MVTNGSSGDLPLVRLLLNPIFADYNIIVASPNLNLPESEFIISEKFINNYALLKYIDVIICHCGNGTVYQGLSFGVPVLCATTIFEQEWNLQRIEDLKLGEKIGHINEAHELYKAIKRWDDKKNSEPFQEIKNSISLYQNQLYETESFLLKRLMKISGNNGKYEF